ncbi:PD40 domain-containing protein, partial [bacterium]|nr:PD40 domain-containing protein [bacterium]
MVSNGGIVFVGNFRGAGIFKINSSGLVKSIGEDDEMRIRHATIWNNFLLCKKITDRGQIPLMINLATGRILKIFPPVQSAGVPQPYLDKLLIPYGDKFIIWKDGTIQQEFSNECRVHWVSVDENHHRFAYVHDDGRIIIRDIDSGTILKKLPPLGYKPEFSPDGDEIAVINPDGVAVANLNTGEIWKCKDGLNFVWDNCGNGLFVQKTVYENVEKIVYSDIFYFVPGEYEINLTQSGGVYEAMPSISPDGKNLAFTTLDSGDVYLTKILRIGGEVILFDIQKLIDGKSCPKIPYRKHNNGTKSDLWVPYLHQCYDVPDYFNGSSSCGPTSALMAIQRYGKLPPHPITCSTPYTHTHDFGWYVPNEYEYDGYVFDHPGLAPKVGDYDSDTTVYGAHGLCCSPVARVGTYGDSLVFLINHHDLYSCWLNGTEYSVSWSTYTGEIDNGYPVPALLPGHYNCFRGYFINHVIISNDPYGDANDYPRKNYDGVGCYYDWSGYDNGYWDASVRFLFAARGTYIPQLADTIVDDFSGGFSYYGPSEYWRAFIGGYEGHAFWTGSVSSGSDVNYATWTPHLPADGSYEVLVYIPSTNATAAARYRIFHSGSEDTVVVDQSVFSDEWVSIGTYDFVDGDYIYVGDVTGTSGQRVCCDAIWFSWRGGEPLPDTIVDDGDAGFHRGGDAVFWHDGTGGYENHFWWTYSTYAA